MATAELETLDQQNLDAPQSREAATRFPAAEFAEVADVPLFSEHSRKNPKTEEIEEYDSEALAAICRNSNFRIEDTGDYAPVVIRHTPRQGEPDRDPEVIGFAGNFHMGVLGNIDPRDCIFCTFWIFRDKRHLLRKYPRRSIEIWTSGDLHSRFIDLVALLGAEAPFLDLGLTYRRGSKGEEVTRYSAVSPGATNVEIPGMVDDKERYMAPEDIQQFIDAVNQLDWVQDVKAMLEASKAPQPTTDPNAAPGAGDPNANLDQFRKYAADNDQAGASEFLGGLSDDDRDKLRCSMEGDENKECYAFYELAAGTEEDKSVDNDKDKGGNSSEVAQYKREVVESKRRTSKLENENRELRQRIERIEQEKTETVRYTRLQELAQDHVLDPNEEIKEVMKLDDAGWERAQAHYQNYERRPNGNALFYTKDPEKGRQGIEGDKGRTAKAVALAQSKNIPFADAYQQVGA